MYLFQAPFISAFLSKLDKEKIGEKKARVVKSSVSILWQFQVAAFFSGLLRKRYFD